MRKSNLLYAGIASLDSRRKAIALNSAMRHVQDVVHALSIPEQPGDEERISNMVGPELVYEPPL